MCEDFLLIDKKKFVSIKYALEVVHFVRGADAHTLEAKMDYEESVQEYDIYFLKVNVCSRDPDKALRWLARYASHFVQGCDDPVGPRVSYLYRNKEIKEGNLTRRQLIFGVDRLADNIGGFQSLAIWRESRDDVMYVSINLSRAQAVKGDAWIIPFVRKIIEKAGWNIGSETLYLNSLSPSRKIAIL